MWKAFRVPMFTVAEKIMIERKKQRGRKKEKLIERRGEKGRVCLNDMIIIYSSPYCEFPNDLPQFSLSPSFHRTFSFPLHSFRFPSLHILLSYSIIFPFSTDRVILNNRTICFETRREHQSIIPYLFRMRRGEWTGCGEGVGREWTEGVVGFDYFGDGLLFILPTITVSNWENTHYCVSTR